MQGTKSPVAQSCGLLNHLDSFRRGMFKLNAKFEADSLLCSLGHFECDGHTVHMFIPQCLPPPLTSTVRSSLFTHAHSSPLSLAVRFHRCCANHSHYINNGWTFSEQTSYTHLKSSIIKVFFFNVVVKFESIFCFVEVEEFQ